MKTAIPKDILAITADIRTRRAAIEQCGQDIERMKDAATEADRLNAEMEELSQKRAEHKAMALVAGKPADLKELDAKQDALERASRQAREDGVAATLAITMLETKIAEIEAEIEQLTEQRKEKMVASLAAQREKAIDHYLELLRQLGPVIAEALAVETARRALIGGYDWRDDIFKEVQELGFPIPGNRRLDVGKFHDSYWRNPIEWVNDREYGKPERDALFAALRDAEVL